MSIAPIVSSVPVSAPVQQTKAAAPPPSPVASSPQDTVAISHAARQVAAPSGDVDRDGDSH